MRLITYILTIALTTFFSCGRLKPKENNPVDKKETHKANIIQDDPHHRNDLAQLDLQDSFMLKHIQGQFYKSKAGQLFERTIGQKEISGHLTDIEYFNGYISQQVDPLTFEPLDGWYAKDKNFVYYYKPFSGGMQISKIDTADTKTFKLLAGHYKYALDKNFFYDEPEIIEGFIPGKTNLKLNIKGKVIEMTCNNKTYKFELVN